MFSGEGSSSRVQEFEIETLDSNSMLPPIKKRRNLPGTPDPEAEVIALSPRTLLATNRFVCEVCNRGFQRDQNLQLHRRGHNLSWKLKRRNVDKDSGKKVYVCPEPSCLHHHPSRALGDLTGIKKHYCRKHGEKRLKCNTCDKVYAVDSDLKVHSKICATRNDTLIPQSTICDALAEESAGFSFATNPSYTPTTAVDDAQLPFHFTTTQNLRAPPPLLPFSAPNRHFRDPWIPLNPNPNENMHYETLHTPFSSSSLYQGGLLVTPPFRSLSATMRAIEGHMGSSRIDPRDMRMWLKRRDELARGTVFGLTGEGGSSGGGRTMPFNGGLRFPAYDRDWN